MHGARRIPSFAYLIGLSALLLLEGCSSNFSEKPELVRSDLEHNERFISFTSSIELSDRADVERNLIDAVSSGKERQTSRGRVRRKGALVESKSYSLANGNTKNEVSRGIRRPQNQLRRRTQSCVSGFKNLREKLENASRNEIVTLCSGTMVARQVTPITVKADFVKLQCRSKPCRINKQNRPQRLFNWVGDSGTIEDIEFMNARNVNGNGGVILFSGGGVHSVVRSVFRNNRAQKGGAIYARGGSGLVEIVDSRFQNNRANTGGAAFIENGSRSDATDNGGSRNEASRCKGIFYRNNGGSSAQCVGVNDGNTGGGANNNNSNNNNNCVSNFNTLRTRIQNGNTNIRICNNAEIIVSSELRVIRDDTTISCNGCKLIAGGASRFFYVVGDNCSFRGLHMKDGDSVRMGDGGNGGAMYLSGTETEIFNCEFNGNRGNNGGAIYAKRDVAFKISRCDFADNAAQLQGGAVYLQFFPDEDQVNGQENSGRGNNARSMGGCSGIFNARNSICETLVRSL